MTTPESTATPSTGLPPIDPAIIKAAMIEAFKANGQNIIKLNLAVTDKVRSLVDDKVKEAVKPLDDTIRKMVEDAVRPVCTEVTVRGPSSTVSIKGLTHNQFKQVLALVSTALPVYLWGAAGAGKTTLAGQIARALELPFYPVYGGPTLTESKLLGYKNASTGHYVKGLCYDAYVSGGLLFIDEADVGEGLIGLNALLANDEYRFPDGELVKRHPNCRVLAAGNTNWNGASGSYKRQSADGAFKDRFIRVPFHYDEGLELALVADEMKPWARYVQSVRKYVANKTKDNRAIISPRSIIKGAAAIQSGGMTLQEAIDHIVLTDLSDDVKLQVKKEVPAPDMTIKEEAKKPRAKKVMDATTE